jgi:hypothetical protein
MKCRYLLILVLMALPVIACASSNYAECLLDNLPDVQNDVAAYAAVKMCRQQYPAGIDGVEYGSSRGWLGYNTPEECTLKKSANTRSDVAARGINLACQRLYGAAPPKTPSCGEAELSMIHARGYTDGEIIDKMIGLPKYRNFNLAGARKAGYSDAEIAEYLVSESCK